jgi:hypothetical protein
MKGTPVIFVHDNTSGVQDWQEVQAFMGITSLEMAANLFAEDSLLLAAAAATGRVAVKKLISYPFAGDNLEEFTFTVTDDAANPVWLVPGASPGANISGTIKVSGNRFILRNDQEALLTLPTGNYRITENAKNDSYGNPYLVTVNGSPGSDWDVTVTNGSNTAGIFRNTHSDAYANGALAVTKMVLNGTQARSDTLYDFTLTGAGLEDVTSNVSFDRTAGDIRFRLANGQTAFFYKLDFGTYTLEETNTAYVADVAVETGEGASLGNPAAVSLDAGTPAQAVYFANELRTGRLSVSKTVDANGRTIASPPGGYPFQLFDADWNPVNLSAYPAVAGAGDGKFTLNAGQTVTFDTLPVGDYWVTELSVVAADPDDQYTRSFKIGSGTDFQAGDTVAATVATNPTTAVAFKNTYLPNKVDQTASLIVSKMALNIANSQYSDYYEFILEKKQAGGGFTPVDLTGKITGAYSASANDLSQGRFRLANGATAFISGLDPDEDYRLRETPVQGFDTYFVVGS